MIPDDPYYLFSVATTFTAVPIFQVKRHVPKHPASNIDSVEWDESTVVPEDEVVVKSNEVGWSEHPWPKSEFLRECGLDLIAGLRGKPSVDEAAAAVMAAMSHSEPVCSREQWRATPSDIASWSPDSAREWWIVQAPFLASTKEFSAYGTVSQTLLMVDRELRATHLWMRPVTVDEDSRSVLGDWTKFHFPWP
ncbi:hypothetical protein FOL47_011109 [Perkinsus chesapeaki]|uniref:Uncharacterized protein n=1 Tax=Perkinsus chesapeaki TaxID=330153 RepID=A0A7J6MNT4_PERCH|nr:hypothetical protein FOL47_011109 [Perkinsus chesapeaki]